MINALPKLAWILTSYRVNTLRIVAQRVSLGVGRPYIHDTWQFRHDFLDVSEAVVTDSHVVRIFLYWDLLSQVAIEEQG